MTITHYSKQINWEPLPELFGNTADVLQKELSSWRGTPYLLGACCKKYGVDCVRYCCAAVDRLFGYRRCPREYLPQDTCFHNKRSAMQAMRKLRAFYAPLVPLRKTTAVQPGDVLVVGPRGGGPGHLMIVGSKMLWHMTCNGPESTSMVIPGGYDLFRTYRFGNREQWAETTS